MLSDALRYMRVKAKEPDDKLINSITASFQLLNNIIRPRKIYGRFSIIRENNFLNIAGINLNSQHLANLLKNSHECCLMAVTLGHEADREILKSQSRSMAAGLILDACASVMADVICDELEREIIENLNLNFKNSELESKLNFKLTPRFSPGYGDVPLSISQDIIDILNANKYIGLSMTKSGMMSPVKSITAIAGVINNNFNFNNFNRCELCNHRQDCKYKI
ncbi:MAG: hypothetical protein IJ576_02220 [Synergistaceae bacterium]|nr:hypothetical protein [Synergistaceae bacterium]MBR1417763.1 hypothetical protein [Synergistaceae bacterium]